LLLGIALVLSSALNRELAFSIVHIVVGGALVYHEAGNSGPLWAAMRLLRWLVLPILLLHMLLTPGAVLWPELPLPISREGAQRGVWLSLHLVEMFMAAMAMSRILSWYEWLQWLAKWPGIGSQLVRDARLFVLIQRDVRLLLEKQRRKWRQNRFDLVLLAKLLAETLMQALGRSELQASRLWRHWQSRHLQALLSGHAGMPPHRGMTLVAGCLMLLLLYRLADRLVEYLI